jgi:hypothetical protein
MSTGRSILLALRNGRPATRLDPQHLGQPRRAGGSQEPVFIGRPAGIVQVEIVCKVMVRTNEQKKATAGGQVLQHEEDISWLSHAGLSSRALIRCRTG